jgi:hypothetical protein
MSLSLGVDPTHLADRPMLPVVNRYTIREESVMSVVANLHRCRRPNSRERMRSSQFLGPPIATQDHPIDPQPVAGAAHLYDQEQRIWPLHLPVFNTTTVQSQIPAPLVPAAVPITPCEESGYAGKQDGCDPYCELPFIHIGQSRVCQSPTRSRRPAAHAAHR